MSVVTVAGGGVIITIQDVENGGNVAKAGLKVGDQVLYTSSFLGNELWPTDTLGFIKTAIQAKPDSVYFVVCRLEQLIYALIVDSYIPCKNLLMSSWKITPVQCRAPKRIFARY
ncbi:Rubredoxin-like domain containing [Olea europaea subsp. europaea]|uniref:Rubredoxin-like domain containing n=1 Tax=Olea europaea subsp. europaea TaxID=158383 RepID=A0A8S0Q474_OLEEU|nr:Rubredoxin-like domain containing [Olea europaea subsp. europaea]